MPFIMRNKSDSTVLTAVLVNHYDLSYYGTRYWEEEEDAAQDFDKIISDHQLTDPQQWEIIEVEDQVLKVCNVKLKNDPSNQLFLDDHLVPTIKKSMNKKN